jgi:hypothetical protein
MNGAYKTDIVIASPTSNTQITNFDRDPGHASDLRADLGINMGQNLP